MLNKYLINVNPDIVKDIGIFFMFTKKKTKPMKIKLFFLAAATVFVVSCSSKKSATVAAEKTPKEVVLTPELLAGKSLYENSCARCHKLYSPKDYTKESWKPILVSMQKKARLDDTQMASISNYINSQL